MARITLFATSIRLTEKLLNYQKSKRLSDKEMMMSRERTDIEGMSEQTHDVRDLVL